MIAIRDYASNGPKRMAEPRSVKDKRNTKSVVYCRSPITSILLAGSILVCFGVITYLVNGKGTQVPSIEEQVKANRQLRAQVKKPPQDTWGYIERLKNRDVNNTIPPLPTEQGQAQQIDNMPSSVDIAIPKPVPHIGDVIDRDADQEQVTSGTSQELDNKNKAPDVDEAKPFVSQPTLLVKSDPVVDEIDRKAERERMNSELRTELELAQVEMSKEAIPFIANSRYMLQCAALRSLDAAQLLKARIALDTGLFSNLQAANGPLYKVIIGPFDSKSTADAANRRLQNSGIRGCFLKNA